MIEILQGDIPYMEALRFKQILLPLNSTLYRIAYRMTNDPDIAKDMVQEAYITMWNKRNELDDVENIESYAKSVVKNKCIDFLRSTHIHEELFTDVVEDFDIESDIEEEERLNIVMRKLDLLPARQKQILLMRGVQDLTFEEIEQLTGLSNMNIRTLLSRARKRLRELCEIAINK